MAQTLTTLRALLTEAGAAPNRRLGQNFLIDLNLLHRVADAGELAPDDRVLEIGPGTGSLSETILAALGPAGRLLACEYDQGLYRITQARIGADPRVRLVHADARPRVLALLSELARPEPIHPPTPPADALPDSATPTRPTPSGPTNADHRAAVLKLVANLPYQIAAGVVAELLLAPIRMGLLAFTVQKEVALRLVAPPGTADYGPLSLVAGLFGQVRILACLPPQAFWPVPGVESALVQVRPHAAGPLVERFGPHWAGLEPAIRHLMGYRRKTLSATIRQLTRRDDLPLPTWPRILAQALEAAGIDPTQRAEQLTLSDWAELCRHLPPVPRSQQEAKLIHP